MDHYYCYYKDERRRTMAHRGKRVFLKYSEAFDEAVKRLPAHFTARFCIYACTWGADVEEFALGGADTVPSLRVIHDTPILYVGDAVHPEMRKLQIVEDKMLRRGY